MVFTPFSSMLTLACLWSFFITFSRSVSLMNVLRRRLLNSDSEIEVIRSRSFSISYILLSDICNVVSFGMGITLKSSPFDISSSSTPRSLIISCTLIADGRKLSRLFLRLRSRSFLSHITCLVTSLASPPATA